MTLREVAIAVGVLIIVGIIWAIVFERHSEFLMGPDPELRHLPARQIPASDQCEYNIDRINEICWLLCGESAQLITKYEGCSALLSKIQKE